MKTNELTGAALDWAVAKCEGFNHSNIGAPQDCSFELEFYLMWDAGDFRYSTDWAQGGPIIEREAIQLTPDEYTQTWSAYTTNEGEPFEAVASTLLIAAMQCYVASKLGDEVEIPEELTQGEAK